MVTPVVGSSAPGLPAGPSGGRVTGASGDYWWGATPFGDVTDTRLPESWLNDRRIRRLSSDAYRSFVVALMWSVSNQTDGYIDDADLDLIPGFVFPHQGELRESGLWVRVESGWHITVFAETQTSHDELVALSHARAVEREKKARWRANKKAQVGELSRGQSRGQSTVDEDRDYTGQDRTGQDSLRSSCPVPPKEVTTPTEVTNPPSQKPSLRKSGTSPGEPDKRATRLPADWIPPREVIDAMKVRFPHVDLKTQHELFCNYWHAKSGQHATKRDWAATWRNWIIKAASETPTRNGHVARADGKVLDFQHMKATPATGRSEERLQLE